jgi:hypothetical protein
MSFMSSREGRVCEAVGIVSRGVARSLEMWWAVSGAAAARSLEMWWAVSGAAAARGARSACDEPMRKLVHKVPCL